MKLIIIKYFVLKKEENCCENDCNLSDIKYVLCGKPMISKCDNLLYSMLVTESNFKFLIFLMNITNHTELLGSSFQMCFLILLFNKRVMNFIIINDSFLQTEKICLLPCYSILDSYQSEINAPTKIDPEKQCLLNILDTYS